MVIGVGNDFQQADKLPGWEEGSWGYHSDDGKIFEDKEPSKSYGPPFKAGDVVGCAIDTDERSIWFTKNRERLGEFCPQSKRYSKSNPIANGFNRQRGILSLRKIISNVCLLHGRSECQGKVW